MKSIKITLLTYCLSLWLMGASFAEEPHPNLVLNADTVDFGDVRAEDSPIRKQVELSNTGTMPLCIDSVKRSCACVETELDTMTVMPGESVMLNITLNLSSYPSHTVKGQIYLHTNDPLQEEQVLLVKATVLPEYTVTPEDIDFGEIPFGSVQSKQVSVRQTGDQELILESIESSSLQVVAKIVDTSDTAPKTFTIEVAVQPDTSVGRLHATLTINTNIQRIPQITIPVQAQITGIEVGIDPKVFVFGPVSPGKQMGTIEIVGDNPFELLSATCTLDIIHIEIEEIESLKRYRLLVSAIPGTSPGDYYGTIHLKLKSGSLTEDKQLSVYGTITQ